MGNLGRRLGKLEERFGAGNSDPRELRLRLLSESFRRLSIVEMHVLEELRVAHATRGEQSRAELWHHLTDAQRAIGCEWSRAVTAAWRDAIETDETIVAREKERLRMETLNAVCAYPLQGGESESTYEENRRKKR